MKIPLTVMALVCVCSNLYAQMFGIGRGNHRSYERREQKNEIRAFKHHDATETFLRNTGPILPDPSGDLRYVQFDSVRVYFEDNDSLLKELFLWGWLTPERICSELADDCLPEKEFRINYHPTGVSSVDEFYSWPGRVILVSNLELLPYAQTRPFQRRFKFYCLTQRQRFNGGNHVFLLELTYKNGDRKTDLRSFIHGATGAMLKYHTSII